MINRILENRHIIITAGTGGVGKTTLSAALAFRAAMLGKKTVVITIDPAKRLATSLGLSTLGDHPTDLTPMLKAIHEKSGGKGEIKGTLAAIMPDTRKTFENFVAELAPNEAIAEQVIRNPIFQIFAKEFSGTNEYMALERLYALNEEEKYDTIILDTPPSRNTLAFLDAPTLLARFFEERLIKWLVLPANKLVSTGMRKALGILEKLTGAGFMTHLFDFASALFEVRVNFTANLKKMTDLMASPQVGFLMVTTPTPDTVPEAQHFIEQVVSHGFHFDGIALNRTLGYLKIHERPSHEGAIEIIKCLQNREAQVLKQLGKQSIPVLAKLPELARDVHSVEDLFHVAMAL